MGAIQGNFHVGDVYHLHFQDGTNQEIRLSEIKDKLQDDLLAQLLEIAKGKDFYDKIAKALQKPKKYLWGTPSHPEVFLGRAKNIEDLHEKLFDREQENILLLVNGQGGIGKSTLAAKYYHEYKNEYQHLAWVLASPTILDAVLNLAMPLNVSFPKEMPNEQRLEVLLTEMANLDKPCLLILDNANDLTDLEKHYKNLRSCTNFHILITSKINKLGEKEPYKVLPLSKDFALKLFTEYYP